MIKLKLQEIDISSGNSILSVSWEVATTKTFDAGSIVAKSEDDTVNKSQIIFNKELDVTKTYYARARAILAIGGYTPWGNVDIFIPKETDTIGLGIDSPTALSAPELFTSSIVNNHVSTMFEIFIGNVVGIGDSQITEVTYFIETITSDVVWSRKVNTGNMASVMVDDIILRNERIYRLRAIVKTSSNDLTPVVTKTIYVGSAYSKLLNTFSDITVENDYVLKVAPVVNVSSVNYKIFGYSNGTIEEIFNSINSTSYPFDCVVPGNTLKKGGSYLFYVKSNMDEVPVYYSVTIGDWQGASTSATASVLNPLISSDKGNKITTGSDGGLYTPGPRLYNVVNGAYDEETFRTW